MFKKAALALIGGFGFGAGLMGASMAFLYGAKVGNDTAKRLYVDGDESYQNVQDALDKTNDDLSDVVEETWGSK